MRDLKFRLFNEGGFIHFNLGENLDWDVVGNVEDSEQFTGLKDSHNKEIYEGDIILLDGAPYKYEIVWDKWRWCVDSKGIISDSYQSLTSAIYNRAIVIGNIHENSELLK